MKTGWKVLAIVQAVAFVLLVGVFAIDRFVIEEERRNLDDRLRAVQERTGALAMQLQNSDANSERRLRALENDVAKLEIAVSNLNIRTTPPAQRKKILRR